MSALSVLEEYPDFASASHRAKELAIRYSQRTGIEQSPEGWAVLVSQDVLSALAPIEEVQADYEDYSDPYDDDYQKEVIQPLIEEIQGDQDAWARSEEDGWFYED